MSEWQHPGAAELAGRRIAVVGLGKSGRACARALTELTEARVSVWDADITKLGAVTALPVDTGGSDPTPAELARKVLAWRPDVIIPAPAIPEIGPLFTTAADHGIELWSEIELAWRLRTHDGAGHAAPWLAVTGTNGKTTTVTMAAHILRAAHLGAEPIGNVGNPAVTAVSATGPDAPRAFALELSSFQLRTTHTMEPAASICLNIADDHLEWHGNRAAYAAAKARIYEHVRTAAVYPVGDSTVQSMVDSADVREGARAIGITTGIPAVGQIGIVDGLIVDRAYGKQRWTSAVEIASLNDVAQLAPTTAALPRHLIWDALAAVALTRAIDIPAEVVRAGLQHMHPGHHRIETVSERAGVRYVDDSKATNAHAALASVSALAEGTCVWIVGGQPKGARFESLVAQVRDRLRAVVVIGVNQEPWHAALDGANLPVTYIDPAASEPMARAVLAASRYAQTGDTVMLAPASASMDQFTSYADRGDRFAAAVRALPAPSEGSAVTGDGAPATGSTSAGDGAPTEETVQDNGAADSATEARHA
ncbi:UDP-N-acetylmuramoyl-L-alanine--D-glutamate ligase [Actinotignum sp. GS-2025b]|uniref:UDP-N-acetylmuramoyl-L-alanine--D-glutamate ligase n=1 Tax=Actinotignum sp. GS-2025b TaxID=3427275 RepID=UPI003F447B49